MVTLSGFADEISSDLDVQLNILQSEGIRYIEFRGIWNKNVLDLTDNELTKMKKVLHQKGFRISSIGSPIGKISIIDNFEEHVKRFERAIYVAKFFDTKYIRIFSFYIPGGKDPEFYRDEVMRRLSKLVKKAEEEGIVLLHENEKDTYGDNAERCLDIMKTIHSSHLQSAFDPANFVQCGVKPYSEAYPLLQPYIEYVHIKDALFIDGKEVPAGQGDGEVQEVLGALINRGYNGYLSLEPHLAASGTFSGFSGPELFKVSAQALKDLLTELQYAWK
ncbi:sugar phosphate isomerase/epimerase family protein [Heyndrickxia acidicola]|uniref:Sugar phosphate isomerase/epimerase n=1 Tax=Heyndrickxia acidicola TaxID=209389 RepID=A0ABU6MBK2_9BACI|nr:sugar phosphate isomerase/epimerase family protein [Heyndrickxia acidicola]MED1201804.1 sugar phosphate isomerase/epimerase [Heyndrickxia acidicola]